MDWPKIKSILIIVLVVMNVMLGFTYYSNRLRFETDAKNNLDDVMMLYRSKDVGIVETKFDFPSIMRSSNVEFLQIDPSIIQNLLGAGFTFDGEQYRQGDKIVIFDESRIVYASEQHLSRVKMDVHRSMETVEDALERSFLTDKVIKFISEYGLDIQYDQIEVLSFGDYVVVKLNQSIEGFKLIESITNFWLYKDEIVGFKRENPIKISTVQGSKYDIISLDRALYSVLPKIDSKETVQEISLVYKLNDESLLVANLIQGEALPYYQIALKSGVKYHVRAIQTIN